MDGEESLRSPPSLPSAPRRRRWRRRAATRLSVPAAVVRASRSAAAAGATPTRPAARGAAAAGDGKVPGASAEMPGSDTALTVDRTYSDPGRHQRCKSRVSGAGRVAVGAPVGAPGRGARPRGLHLPRELLSPAFPCLLLSLPCYPGSGTLRPCPCWRGWEGGVGACLACGWETPGPPPGWGAEQRPARRLPLAPRRLGSLAPCGDAGISPTAALCRPLRQGAPAARCPDARESRHPRPGVPGGTASLS